MGSLRAPAPEPIIPTSEMDEKQNFMSKFKEPKWEKWTVQNVGQIEIPRECESNMFFLDYIRPKVEGKDGWIYQDVLIKRATRKNGNKAFLENLSVGHLSLGLWHNLTLPKDGVLMQIQKCPRRHIVSD